MHTASITTMSQIINVYKAGTTPVTKGLLKGGSVPDLEWQ